MGRAKSFVIIGTLVFLFCSGLLSALFFTRLLDKKAIVRPILYGILNGIGLGVTADSAMSYDIESKKLPMLGASIKNFKVDAKTASISLDSVVIFYDIFKNTLKVRLPQSAIRVSLNKGITGVDDALKCRISGEYSINFEKNLLFQAIRKFVTGREVDSSISAVDYVDNHGMVCLDPATGKEEALYAQGYFSMTRSNPPKNSGRGSILKVDAHFFKNGYSGEESIIIIKDFSISQLLRARGNSVTSADIRIPLFELNSDKFGVLINGEFRISEKCLLISLARCESDLFFKIRGFDDLAETIGKYLQFSAFNNNPASSMLYAQAATAFIEVLRTASSRSEDDSVTLRIKSDGNTLNIGKMLFDEFSRSVLEKLKTISNAFS